MKFNKEQIYHFTCERCNILHLFVLILIITIGIALTSCVNWTPVEYIDSPIKETTSEKVVMNKVPLDDCFIGSSSDECVDFTVVEPVCNMDLCT